jgi:hypothetical protein
MSQTAAVKQPAKKKTGITGLGLIVILINLAISIAFYVFVADDKDNSSSR